MTSNEMKIKGDGMDVNNFLARNTAIALGWYFSNLNNMTTLARMKALMLKQTAPSTDAAAVSSRHRIVLRSHILYKLKVI